MKELCCENVTPHAEGWLHNPTHPSRMHEKEKALIYVRSFYSVALVQHIELKQYSIL